MNKDIDLGKCCACQGTENVRNLIMHTKPAPVPGSGWGCVACNLPMNGALSVICDDCLESNAEITEVCMGWPTGKMRAPIHALRDEPFDHDLRFHEEEKRA